jgi:uncharacterized membrane protein
MTPTPATFETIGVRRSLGARLRNYLIAGILVTAPIGITVFAAWSIITGIDDAVTSLLPEAYNPNTYFYVSVPGVGLLVLVAVLTVIGFLTTNYLGRLFVRTGERMVDRMPIVRSVYAAVKQLFESVLSNRVKSFNEVVLVEFPRKGMWTLGLVIGESYSGISDKVGEKMFNVYLPTTPNPTSGYLVFLPRTEMIRLDMSVEDCMKMIVSGGIVSPPQIDRTG